MTKEAKVKKTKKKISAGEYTPEQLVELASKEYGEGTLMLYSQGALQNVPVVSTGSIAIDKALGVGGLPYGRIVEVYGPESSGKTTLCLETIANVQIEGHNVGFIDMEHALDMAYAESIGVDINKLLLSQPDCGEDALNLAQMLLRTRSLKCLVIDSVAALIPRAELEGEMGESHMGLQARLMSQAMRKLVSLSKKSECLVIFTNQIRHKIGVMFGSPETTTGGGALKFYASIRIDMRMRERIKDGSGKDAEIIGNKVGIKIVKNKIAPPFKVTETRIMYDGLGFDNAYDVTNMAVDRGIIVKSGSWYKYGDISVQGEESMIEALAEDPDLLQVVVDEINEPDAQEYEEEEEEVDEVAEVAEVAEEIKKLKKKLKKQEKGSKKYKKIKKKIKELKNV